MTKKQKNFLEIYRDNEIYYSIRKSCKKAGIGKSTLYRWLKENPEFKKEIQLIKKKRKNDPFRQIKKGNIMASIRFLKKAVNSFKKGDYATMDKQLALNDQGVEIFRNLRLKC